MQRNEVADVQKDEHVAVAQSSFNLERPKERFQAHQRWRQGPRGAPGLGYSG